ncbi:MAG: hypothetical protein ACRDP6_10495 [Actinoallomurus sp.]
MSSTPGSGDRAESLGVRRPVELPEADIEAAGDLTPAAGSDAEAEPEPEDAEVISASGSGETGTEPEESAGAKESPADAAEPEKKVEGDKDPLTRTAVAVTPPVSGDGAGDGMPPDRPKKPVLAAVAIGGAVVLAIPLLLIGTGSHHGKKHRTTAAADTVLPGDGQLPSGAYTSTSPSPSGTPTPSHSASPKHSKPKASKNAGSKPSAKASVGTLAHRQGVPSSQRPLSGGNPFALEVHAAYDINPGKTLRTNRVALTMQSNGDLVLRDTSSKIIWSTGTHHSGSYAEFQTDGNLVVYFNGRQAVWASGTPGHQGATLVLQADDNMVIFNGQDPIWASGTNR